MYNIRQRKRKGDIVRYLLALCVVVSQFVFALPLEFRIGLDEEPAMEAVFKFGYSGSVETTEEQIWDGATPYTYLGAATALKISSDDTDDDDGGTGARTVQIYGCDGDYEEVNEVVTLDGQTAVTTTNTYLRVWRMIVRSAGSQGVNDGKIYAGTGTVTGGVPANIYAQISDTRNQTLMAIYTVPVGKTALLNTVRYTCDANKTVTVLLRVRPFGEVFQTKDLAVLHAGAKTVQRSYPMKIDAKSDIEILGAVSTGSTEVSASFELVLVDRE